MIHNIKYVHEGIVLAQHRFASECLPSCRVLLPDAKTDYEWLGWNLTEKIFEIRVDNDNKLDNYPLEFAIFHSAFSKRINGKVILKIQDLYKEALSLRESANNKHSASIVFLQDFVNSGKGYRD